MGVFKIYQKLLKKLDFLLFNNIKIIFLNIAFFFFLNISILSFLKFLNLQ